MVKAQTTKLYNWAIAKAESRKSPFWISLLFGLEILLFLPLDAVLMFFCLQNRKKVFLYIILATIASTISGIAGYLIGHFLWDLVSPYVVPHLISAASFHQFSLHFQTYEHWAIFFGALLPFPLKILTLSAGIFDLGLLPFFTYFISARLIRFLVIGGSVLIWGDKIKSFLDRNFHQIFLAIGAKMALVGIAFWFFSS